MLKNRKNLFILITIVLVVAVVVLFFMNSAGKVELIERIEVYNIEGSGKAKTQRILIYYRFIGILDIPQEFSGYNVVIEPREGVAIEYLPQSKKLA